jgi:serine/threonine protein kinase
MELLPGALPDLLRQIRPYSLPMSSMRKLALQLLTSLSFLSSQGVIHADIRPENVGPTPRASLARGVHAVFIPSEWHLTELPTD